MTCIFRPLEFSGKYKAEINQVESAEGKTEVMINQQSCLHPEAQRLCGSKSSVFLAIRLLCL